MRRNSVGCFRTLLDRPRLSRTGCTFLLVLPLLAALISCDRARPTPLRIGLNPWVGTAFLHLAEVKGFFADEGVDVRIVEYSSMADVRRGMELGQLDMAGVTAVEALHVYEHSDRVHQVVLVTDYSVGADAVLAREHVRSIADLKGKRIGVEAGSLNLYVLSRALEGTGLGLGDMTVVPTNQSEMAAAMAAGTLDCAVTYAPFDAAVRRAARVNELYTTREAPDALPNFLVADCHLFPRRSKEVSKVLRAWRRAIAYATEHPQEAHQVMADRLVMPPDDLTAVLGGSVRVVSAEENERALAPGGAAHVAIVRTDRHLRDIGQIRRPNVPEHFVAHDFIRAGGLR